MGKSFLVKEISEESVFASYLIRIRLVEKLLSEYVDSIAACNWLKPSPPRI
ncbi:hypothetical protein EfmAA290_02700 [Enterococcus faecium]|nr:hypothetical protein EfmAA290_02700 [Enterococcus faecium]